MAENRLSRPLLGAPDVEMVNFRKSVSEDLFNTVPDFYKTTGVKDDLTRVSQALKELAPVMIDTPFKGSSLAMTRDEKRFVFGSREGKLGIVDRDTKQVVLDKEMPLGSIWTIALINNDEYLLSAGASGAVKKLRFSDLSEVAEFVGHNDEINFIQVSSDEKTMYTASDDSRVMSWPLEGASTQGKTLYEDNSGIYAIDLSVDNNYIASASQTNAIVYSLKEGKVLMSHPTRSGSYWCVKISTRNTYVAAGDQGGVIYVWKFGTWEDWKVLTGHTQRVRYMSASLDESFLVTAGLDHDIKVWDMKLDRPAITLKGHKDWVKFALISQDQTTIFSAADDKTVASWKIPSFSDTLKFSHPEASFTQLDASSTLLFARVNGKILGYDYKGNQVKCFDLSQFELINYELSADGSQMFVFVVMNGQKKILGWELETETRNIDIDVNQDNYYSGIVMKNLLYAVTGDSFRVNVWNLKDKSCVHTFRSHKGRVMSLMASHDSSRLFSADEQVIKVYDTSKWEEIHAINEPYGVKLMVPSRDDEYFFYINKANQLFVYSLHNMTLIQTIPVFNSNKIYFTKDNDYFIHADGNVIFIRDLDNFEKICSIYTESDIVDFSVSPDESLIVTTQGSETRLQTNPLKCNSLSIFGDSNRIYEYINYCNQIMNSNATHQKEFDSYIIEPYHMNTVHLYSNYNQPKLMELAVAAHSPFYPSRTKHSPLSIATEKKFVDIIEAIFQGLKARLESGDTWAFYHIGESLIGLNRIGFDNLHKIYELGLFKCIDPNLPKFVNEQVRLPIVASSEHPLMNKKDFPDESVFVDEGRAVAFGQTSFRMNLLMGSQASIDMVESVLECENESIYYTKLVHLLLESKWKKVRVFIGIQAIIYVIYLLWLGYYSQWEYGGPGSLIVPCILSSILFIYEIVQMVNSGLDYFTDMWNYIDLGRAALFYAFFIMSFTVSEPEYDQAQSSDSGSNSTSTEAGQSSLYSSNILNLATASSSNIQTLKMEIFTLLVLFSWLRGITYFRLFERTRYLIKLIMEASVDILSFFVLLFYSTLAFAFIMQSVDHSKHAIGTPIEYRDLDEYFLTSYIQNLGEFSESPTNFLTWILFIIISIVNPVIMLNLLISIMGDTYGRVKAGKVIADARELAGMILEVETLMSWNRLKEEKNFFKVLCEESYLKFTEKTPEEIADDLDKQVDKLQEMIDGFNGEVQNELDSANQEIMRQLDNRRG